MAEVGTYYITIMPSMNKFTGAVKSAMGSAGSDAGKSFTASFGDIVKGSALGQVIGAAATSLGNALWDGLSTGIDRADTLRNFPRVMEAMGFSAEDAGEQINKIMERLRGLPASTQDVVRLTQAISDSTGDLGLAADASLAFTDAMIAQGASAGEITQAQGVLNRVLGKGSATTAQWMSLQSVMTPQLNAVAQAMLGAGASSEDLHAALQAGTVTWDDFLRTMVDLDQNGLKTVGKDMQSFEAQARANSDGIGTAIQNMGWRIGTGWASIINAIGVENISGPINALADLISGAMGKVGEGVSYLRDAIAATDIAESLARIGDALGSSFGGFFSSVGDDLKDFADGLISAVDGGLKWMANNGDLVSTALAGIAAGLTAIWAFNLGAKLAALPGIISGVWAALAANPFGVIVTAIAAVVSGLVWFFTQTETGKAIWQGFCDLLAGLWEGLQADWAAFCAVLSQEWESFKAFLDGIPEWWQGIVDYWTAAWDEFAGYMVAAWEKIKADFQAAWDAINAALNAAWTAMSQAVVQWCADLTNAIATAWTNIKSVVSAAVNALSTFLLNGWNRMKDAAVTAWNALKSAVGGIADALGSLLHGRVDAIASYLSNKWDIIRSTATNVWNGIKEVVGGAMDMLRAIVTGDFDAIGSAASRIWNGVKDTIGSAINGAKDLVGNAIDAIKGFFNFEFTWPHIPLPHINFSLIEVPLLGTIPDPMSLSIDWYGKGGVFDAASIIGIGEKGREAALPLNDAVYREMARGIVHEMGGQKGGVDIHDCDFYVRKESDIDAIAEALSVRWSREAGGAL